MSGYMGGGGDNLTSLYLSNPAMAQALRKQQMGLEMTQSWKPQGPVLSPWQGVDSLVKGLMGAYLFNKGNDDIQSAHDKGNADLADAMNKAYGGGAQTAPAPAQPGGAQTAPAPAQPGGAQTAPAPAQPGGGAAGQQLPDAQADGWNTPYYPGSNTDKQLPAIVHQLESGGQMKPGIVGDGGAAAGPMQVHQAALDDVNKAQGTNYTMADLVRDPKIGKAVGDAYLGQLQQRYPGRPDLVLAAYNGGMGNVDKGQIPPSAQQYAQRGLQAMGGTQYAGPGVPQGQQAPQQQMPQQAPSAIGQNAPMVKEALRLQQQATQLMIDHPGDPRFHALAQGMMQRAQTLAGLDTYTTGPDGTQRNVRTGEAKSAATPAMNYQPDPQHTGAWVSPGGKPVFQPSTRPVQLPDGSVGSIDANGNFRPAVAADNPGIAARKAAETQGAETGKLAVKTAADMEGVGRDADTAIGNIDYAKARLADAAKAGIPSGYFSPAIAQAAAMAKSLGIDTKAFSIQPEAVGNIQSAEKSLAVTGGAILRSVLGSSDITDAKVQHFIHTQPNLSTDPDAVNKILDWARSQYTYTREMSMDAMKSADPHTGMLPLGWKQQYIARKGAFAPIFDPLTREMKQPEGEGPSREPPPQPQAQPQQQAPMMAAPPGAVQLLRTNPGMAAQFDAKYGQGAASRVLGGR